jgi:hypothetical protein
MTELINRGRRQAASGLIAAAGCGLMGRAESAGSAAMTGSEDDSLVESWMDKWMSQQRRPVNNLDLGRFPERLYYLRKEVGWVRDPGEPANLMPVTAPVGFLTDFASIPRVFWSFLPPDGDYTYAAVIHDFLYWDQSQSREASDKILYVVMMEFKVAEATARIIYDAVRVGGRGPWKENTRLKANGERRILKEFPDDPRIRWAEWKKDKSHFVQ